MFYEDKHSKRLKTNAWSHCDGKVRKNKIDASKQTLPITMSPQGSVRFGDIKESKLERPIKQAMLNESQIIHWANKNDIVARE